MSGLRLAKRSLVASQARRRHPLAPGSSGGIRAGGGRTALAGSVPAHRGGVKANRASRSRPKIAPVERPRFRTSIVRWLARLAPAAIAGAVVSACGGGPSAGSFVPGTPDDPREVIVVARDYAFDPPVVDLVPGEVVTFQVVNGGLVTHEAIVGDERVQAAWEAAEAAVANPPPGPTPAVSVPPEVAGLRIVVESGQRVDTTWTVPAVGQTEAGRWFLGCHIAGHFALGMVVPVRFVDRGGRPLSGG